MVFSTVVNWVVSKVDYLDYCLAATKVGCLAVCLVASWAARTDQLRVD